MRSSKRMLSDRSLLPTKYEEQLETIVVKTIVRECDFQMVMWGMKACLVSSNRYMSTRVARPTVNTPTVRLKLGVCVRVSFDLFKDIPVTQWTDGCASRLLTAYHVELPVHHRRWTGVPSWNTSHRTNISIKKPRCASGHSSTTRRVSGGVDGLRVRL